MYDTGPNDMQLGYPKCLPHIASEQRISNEPRPYKLYIYILKCTTRERLLERVEGEKETNKQAKCEMNK